MLFFLSVALLFSSFNYASSEQLFTPEFKEGALKFGSKIGQQAGVGPEIGGRMAIAFVSMLDEQPQEQYGPFSPFIAAVYAKLAPGAGVDPLEAVALGSYVGSLLGRPTFALPKVIPGAPLADIGPYVGIQLAQRAGVDPEVGRKMGLFFGSTVDKGPRADVSPNAPQFPSKVLAKFAKKAGLSEDVGVKLGAYLGRHFVPNRSSTIFDL